MKKTKVSKRKLSLNAEVVRALHDAALDEVDGGQANIGKGQALPCTNNASGCASALTTWGGD